MKVKIGKYVHFWTTRAAENQWYRLRYKKYDWEVEDEDKDALDRLVERFLDLWQKTVCRVVNATWGRRPRKVKVVVEPHDVWNADDTLARIILPTLQMMKVTKHGGPNTDDDDVPEHLRSTAAGPKENEWDADENHFARWDWIMDEMIWAFEQILDDRNDEQFWSGVSDTMFQPLDQDQNPVGEPIRLGERSDEKNPDVKMYEMVHGPNHTSTLDKEGWEAHHERIQNGLRLFGKYYRALWT